MDLSLILDPNRLVAPFTEAARAAGDLALGFFNHGEETSADVHYKHGGSPVTEADHLVDAYLKTRLEMMLPEAGWLSEESADTKERLIRRHVLIVDPIDGTRGFAAGDPRWAISIALVTDGRPVLGLLHAPALNETYLAVLGQGATLNGKKIRVSEVKSLDSSSRMAAPPHVAEDLRRAGLAFDLAMRIPSLAVRLVYVASGVLDAGIASENSHDWDIAAADLILHEAGGVLAGLDGAPPVYNSNNTRHGLLTAAPAQIHTQLNAAARRARGL